MPEEIMNISADQANPVAIEVVEKPAEPEAKPEEIKADDSKKEKKRQPVKTEKSKEAKENLRKTLAEKVKKLMNDEPVEPKAEPEKELETEGKEEVKPKPKMEKKVQPKAPDEKPALSEELINRAKSLGMHPHQLDAFDAESLDIVLTGIESKIKSNQTNGEGKPVQEKKEEVKSIPKNLNVETKTPFESLEDLTTDEYDEAFTARDKAIREKVLAQDERIKSLEEKLGILEKEKIGSTQKEIMEALDSADECFKPFIHLNEESFRKRLMETIETIDEIDRRNGKPMCSVKTAIQRSLSFLFPEAKAKLEESKVASKLKERERAISPKREVRTPQVEKLPFRELAVQRLREQIPDLFARTG